MKFKTTALLMGLIFASASHAELTGIVNADGSVTVKNTTPDSPVKVKYDFDKNYPFSKKTYDFQVYRVENKDSLVSSTGVYDKNSPLLKLDGDLIVKSKVLGAPLANMQVHTKTPYIKSSITKTDDKQNSITTEIPGSVKSGIDLSVFESGKNIYNIDLSQVRLDSIRHFSTGDARVDLPDTSSWSASQKVYIPEGKTARIDSPKYNLNGKDYKDVYLISAN